MIETRRGRLCEAKCLVFGRPAIYVSDGGGFRNFFLK